MVCTTRYLLNAAITVGWVVLCVSVSLSAGRPEQPGSPTKHRKTLTVYTHHTQMEALSLE